MIDIIAPTLVCLIFSMLLLAALPSRRACNVTGFLRLFVARALGVQAIAAFLLVVQVAMRHGEPLTYSIADFGIRIYVDGTSSLMLAMISLVGFVVARFSIRYLDGEAMQGRFFRWLGFTAGAVSLMALAGNALLFFFAWVATSFGLHQLLLHYRHRKAAHHAAWTKFTISRLGDSFLVAALVLIYRTFGTFDFAELFQQAQLLSETGQATASHAAISWLLVMGAVTKSAQFPFHTWLPNTMETPTPVSALMHAGIVNAGGYLIIRTNPLVVLDPEALAALAAIGGFTVLFAGIVMMTQASIKRQLAYSTIAQMGFMMLQCGFGAFSAAMLHILAHSFYKAHAFLSSGGVIAESQRKFATRPTKPLGLVSLAGAAVLSVAAFSVAAYTLGMDTLSKPGGFTLAFVLCLALTTWGWRLFSNPDRQTLATGAIGVSILSCGYLFSYLAVHFMVQASIAKFQPSVAIPWVTAGVLVAFAVLFGLHATLRNRRAPAWLERWRIHASNGFYIDTIYRRVFGRFATSTS